LLSDILSESLFTGGIDMYNINNGMNPYGTTGSSSFGGMKSYTMPEEKEHGPLGKVLRSPKALAAGGMVLGAIGGLLLASGVGAPLGIGALGIAAKLGTAAIGAKVCGSLGSRVGAHFMRKDQKEMAREMLSQLEPWQVPDDMKKQLKMKDEDFGQVLESGEGQNSIPMDPNMLAMQQMQFGNMGMPVMGDYGMMPGNYGMPGMMGETPDMNMMYGTPDTSGIASQPLPPPAGGGGLMDTASSALKFGTKVALAPVTVPLAGLKAAKNFVFGG
jgi:hypothetical protein